MKHIKKYNSADKKGGFHTPSIVYVSDEDKLIFLSDTDAPSDIPLEVYEDDKIDVEDRFTVGSNEGQAEPYNAVGVFRIAKN